MNVTKTIKAVVFMAVKMHTVTVWVMTLCSGRSVPANKDILPYSGQKTIEKLHIIKEMTVVAGSCL